MQVIGIGVDLVHLSRITDLVGRRGAYSLARRILSKKESELFDLAEDQLGFLQSRFAVKEALFKATSSFKHLKWSEVSLIKGSNGRPFVEFLEEPELAAQVSISHDGGFLVAMAMVFKK